MALLVFLFYFLLSEASSFCLFVSQVEKKTAQPIIPHQVRIVFSNMECSSYYAFLLKYIICFVRPIKHSLLNKTTV
ncbi:hypothetical protein BX070DRAFT_226252 [Coemansia spiralis]|nr:hypothetical protein BX070DRAFT_226252 [Coemansia spiralis]